MAADVLILKFRGRGKEISVDSRPVGSTKMSLRTTRAIETLFYPWPHPTPQKGKEIEDFEILLIFSKLKSQM